MINLISIEEFRRTKYNPKNIDTKNQHYVPQSIIKHFSDVKEENQVHCFHNNYGERNPIDKIKEVSMHNVMRSFNGYEIYNSEPNLLEQYFQYYENKFSLELDKFLLMLENSYSKQKFIDFVFENLNIFLIYYFRASYTMEYYSRKRKNNENKKNDEFVINYDIIKRRIESVLIDITKIEKLSETIKRIYGCPILLQSNNGEFLLSDSFISTWSNNFYSFVFSNREIGFVDTNILIPLSNKYYILFTRDRRWRSEVYKKGKMDSCVKQKVYGKDIDFFNSIIFRNHMCTVVGSYKSLEKMVISLPNLYFNFQQIEGIRLNDGACKSNVFDEPFKDTLMYWRSLENYKNNDLSIIPNTYVEFFNDIVSVEEVKRYIKMTTNGLVDFVVTTDFSKYLREG